VLYDYILIIAFNNTNVALVIVAKSNI